MKNVTTLIARSAVAAALLLACAYAAAAQNPKLNLDSLSKLEPKASKTIDISLGHDLLGLAGQALGDGNDPDAKRVKDLISGISEITVRSYEFDKPGEYVQADIEPIRAQLRSGGWSRLVNVRSRTDGDNAEVYAMMQNDKMLGFAILTAEPDEITVVNIVGSVDLSRLSELNGEFGLPKVELKRKPGSTNP